MIVDFIIIILVGYMLILLERTATVNVGGNRAAFCSIDLCREKKMYAPFKYRPLGPWLAILFNITSKHIKTIMIWAERYSYNIYILDNKGLEKYYIFKYCLLLFADVSFYFYLNALFLPALVGVLILNLFIALTFIYDCYDYLIEIGLYALFLLGVVSVYPFWYFGIIALFASLNRESSILMILISMFYLNFISVIFTFLGFTIGFVIPRIIYKNPADQYDLQYNSGFRFLVFNPIQNWKKSILPPLFERFKTIKSNFFFDYEGVKAEPRLNNSFIISTVHREIFLNRIFLGIVFVVFCFFLFFSGFYVVPSFFNSLTYIFMFFILLISIPADIREIRVYSPVFVVIIPYLLCL